MADLATEATNVLPPQATGATPAGQAADAADIAPAPTATDALLTANFGDQGADQYKALQAAGQQVQVPQYAPPTAPAGGAPAGGGADTGMLSTLLGGNPNQFSPILSLLQGPAGTQKLAAGYADARAAQQEMQMRSQQMATNDATFLKNLKDQPIQMRAALIQTYGAKQGRDISPAEAAYIANITPDAVDHIVELAKSGDPEAIAQMGDLFSGDPVKMVSASSEIKLRNAQADKAIAEAAATPGKITAAAQKSAFDIAKSLRELHRPPTAQEIQVLDAAGLEVYQVPVPGAPNETMWGTRQKGTATPSAPGAPSKPAVVSPKALADAKAAENEAKVKGRVANSPIPPTTAEKLSGYDSALDIIKQLEDLYAKGSPTDTERQNWFNRVKQEVSYKWGFEMPDNLDEDTALRSLGAITAGRAFISGRPNQQLMNEIWKHTGQNPLVSPNQMRNRLDIMRHQVQQQKDRMINYTQAGRGDLAEKAESGPGMNKSSLAYTDKATLQADVASGKIDRATGEGIARKNGWIQ